MGPPPVPVPSEPYCETKEEEKMPSNPVASPEGGSGGAASCGRSSCGNTSKTTCGRCLSVTYCGKACQINDWEVHKLNCKALQQKRAMEEARAIQAREDDERASTVLASIASDPLKWETIRTAYYAGERWIICDDSKGEVVMRLMNYTDFSKLVESLHKHDKGRFYKHWAKKAFDHPNTVQFLVNVKDNLHASTAQINWDPVSLADLGYKWEQPPNNP